MSSAAAVSHKHNPFRMVDVPDSISFKLESAYNIITGCDSVNAGKNVWNLINRKDFVFKNGLYSFKGQGPHFPRCIFIFKDGRTFIFKSVGAFDFEGVLQEYLKCVKFLNLSRKESLKYLKHIVDYLEEESGLTYGREITEQLAEHFNHEENYEYRITTYISQLYTNGFIKYKTAL